MMTKAIEKYAPPTTHRTMQSSMKRTKAKANQVNQGKQMIDKAKHQIATAEYNKCQSGTQQMKQPAIQSQTKNQHTKEIPNVNKRHERTNDLAISNVVLPHTNDQQKQKQIESTAHIQAIQSIEPDVQQAATQNHKHMSSIHVFHFSKQEDHALW